MKPGLSIKMLAAKPVKKRSSDCLNLAYRQEKKVTGLAIKKKTEGHTPLPSDI
jgi:hypothetical protein